VADTHPGDGGAKSLEAYWKKGAGAAKWIPTASPWTNLYNHLKKHMEPEMAKRVAAQWFFDVFHFWPGSDKNRVAHGKPPRGKVIGKG
jgi:hypothetical protein